MARVGLFAVAVCAAVGCSGQPPRPKAPPTGRVPAEPVAGPLLTAVPARAMKLEPDAGRPPYTPAKFRTAGGPEPIPASPDRKPTRVLGDLRFYAPHLDLGGIALSPDGKHLARGACVFDAATGQLEADYDAGGYANGHTVQSLAFSPDGSRVYRHEGPPGSIPARYGHLIVQDPAAKQRAVVQVSAGGWSGDGALLVAVEDIPDAPYDTWWRRRFGGARPAVYSYHNGVFLYDAKTWGGVAGFRVHGVVPTAVTLSPDGGLIVVGGGDGVVRVWDRAAGKEVATFTELSHRADEFHSPVVRRIAFSTDGKTLASANARPHEDAPQQVAWWRWPDRTLVQAKTVGRGVDPTDLRFSPDGKSLFAGSGSGATVWDVATGAVHAHLEYDKHKRAVPFAAFTPDGGRVFVPKGVWPGLLAFPSLDPLPWPDPPFVPAPPKPPFDTVEPMPPTTPSYRQDPAGVKLPDGGRVRALNFDEGRELGYEHLDAAGKRARHYEAGRHGPFAVSPDGRWLATVTYPGRYGESNWGGPPLRFWDLTTGRELGTVQPSPTVGQAFTFSPDGRWLAVAHLDGYVRLWDVATRTPLLALDPTGYGFDRLTFSTDGRHLVAGGVGSPVLLVWDVTDPAR